MLDALNDAWTSELESSFGQLDSLSLRKLVTEELDGKREFYSKFLLNETITDQLLLSLCETMTVTSELLNCVPLALSNIFCIPVIIFSGMLNIPIIPLVPSVPVISTQPVYIAYDGGVEQFFRIRRVEDDLPSAIPANNSVPSVSPAKPKPCRCGNGASKQKNSAS